ncbi:MAG: hypothetical protein JWQ35_2014 [Bacteriovoracaceae bacterium]|nr:hypothetical protein [Bacteriovoracaceae bacterium]
MRIKTNIGFFICLSLLSFTNVFAQFYPLPGPVGLQQFEAYFRDGLKADHKPKTPEAFVQRYENLSHFYMRNEIANEVGARMVRELFNNISALEKLQPSFSDIARIISVVINFRSIENINIKLTDHYDRGQVDETLIDTEYVRNLLKNLYGLAVLRISSIDDFIELTKASVHEDLQRRKLYSSNLTEALPSNPLQIMMNELFIVNLKGELLRFNPPIEKISSLISAGVMTNNDLMQATTEILKWTEEKNNLLAAALRSEFEQIFSKQSIRAKRSDIFDLKQLLAGADFANALRFTKAQFENSQELIKFYEGVEADIIRLKAESNRSDAIRAETISRQLLKLVSAHLRTQIPFLNQSASFEDIEHIWKISSHLKSIAPNTSVYIEPIKSACGMLKDLLMSKSNFEQLVRTITSPNNDLNDEKSFKLDQYFLLRFKPSEEELLRLLENHPEFRTASFLEAAAKSLIPEPGRDDTSHDFREVFIRSMSLQALNAGDKFLPVTKFLFKFAMLPYTTTAAEWVSRLDYLYSLTQIPILNAEDLKKNISLEIEWNLDPILKSQPNYDQMLHVLRVLRSAPGTFGTFSHYTIYALSVARTDAEWKDVVMDTLRMHGGWLQSISEPIIRSHLDVLARLKPNFQTARFICNALGDNSLVQSNNDMDQLTAEVVRLAPEMDELTEKGAVVFYKLTQFMILQMEDPQVAAILSSRAQALKLEVESFEPTVLTQLKNLYEAALDSAYHRKENFKSWNPVQSAGFVGVLNRLHDSGEEELSRARALALLKNARLDVSRNDLNTIEKVLGADGKHLSVRKVGMIGQGEPLFGVRLPRTGLQKVQFTLGRCALQLGKLFHPWTTSIGLAEER